MASLKEVKSRITSVISTQQITKAMRMVAASKLRRSQEKMQQIRPYARKLNTIVSNLTASIGSDNDNDWYATKRTENKILVVVITSDRGLCGAFNSTVLKAAVKLVQEKYPTQFNKGNVTILPFGKRSMEYFSKRKYVCQDSYWGIFGQMTFENVSKAGNYIIDTFKQGGFDKVEIVYNEFKNVATQVLKIDQFLPLAVEASSVSNAPDYIFEPNAEELLAGLIPQLLNVQLYRSVLESNAAEHAARMTAMDKASENAGELLKELKLLYNRSRQAAITKEILEIVGGAEALKSA
ncbi:ATP synthase F1 subunit gamma [Chryseolinea sp. H1M3-3]|uniref:ATP synthase F1 subunit gamma n=1 Tax=Chryseolinea sp. H1M3-3 TaxID=3034144 RepID=UPI0023ED1078|nr:ATP synthase F1 subunit gamma [Chryseolinea sp. H1M3-3]